MKRLSLAIALSALVVLIGVAPAGAADLVVRLNAQNNSGESGTATLSELGPNQTKVTLSLTGAPANVAQPAHIHAGSCANLDPAPKYPLKSVEAGKSETVLDVSMATLTAGGLAVNVHKSAAEAAIYVACGDIAPATASTGTVASDVPQVAPKAGFAPGGSLALTIVGLSASALSIASGLYLRRRAAR